MKIKLLLEMKSGIHLEKLSITNSSNIHDIELHKMSQYTLYTQRKHHLSKIKSDQHLFFLVIVIIKPLLDCLRSYPTW